MSCAAATLSPAPTWTLGFAPSQGQGKLANMVGPSSREGRAFSPSQGL